MDRRKSALPRVCFVVALMAAFALNTGCRSVPDRVIVWQVRESDVLPQLLQLRGIPFTVDGRGVMVSHTPESEQALIDALTVLRTTMDVIANNLANVDTTSARSQSQQTEDGQTCIRHVPYCRKMVILVSPKDGGGNTDAAAGPPELSIAEDTSPFRMVYDPKSPHAVHAPGKDHGMVYYPNINSVVEMTDMMSASREYSEVLTVLQNW